MSIAENAFQIFGLELRPLIDPDRVQQKYLALAAELHPDQGGSSTDFERLNAARQLLLHPGRRLKLLAEEMGWIAPGKQPTEIPDQAAQLFPIVQPVIIQADSLIRKAGETTSPLAKALLARELLRTMEECEKVAGAVQGVMQGLERELSAADQAWPAEEVRPVILRLIGAFAFTSKWRDQLQERIFRLSSFV